ncbi:MAG: DUF1614 domain-containing protein [Candidatus Verstraetearchaeota archaeon]|nr:DUF1614 domain-containing protein [Candidatus Verstraetearchaeota archaeon]
MKKGFFVLPTIGVVLIAFFFMLIILAPLMVLGVVGRALGNVGLGWVAFLTFLLFSLLGSSVNIPVWRRKVAAATPAVRYIYFFGIPYPLPTVETRVLESVLSINLGGAVMPLLLSFYLLAMNPGAIAPSLLATAVVSVAVFLIAKPVGGVGIVTPMFIPPLVAALCAILLGGQFAVVVAYVGGTLGTLLGADLMHLKDIRAMGAVNMSIGGAGTFDGIYLTGLLAVLLAF